MEKRHYENTLHFPFPFTTKGRIHLSINVYPNWQIHKHIKCQMHLSTGLRVPHLVKGKIYLVLVLKHIISSLNQYLISFDHFPDHPCNLVCLNCNQSEWDSRMVCRVLPIIKFHKCIFIMFHVSMETLRWIQFYLRNLSWIKIWKLFPKNILNKFFNINYKIQSKLMLFWSIDQLFFYM